MNRDSFSARKFALHTRRPLALKLKFYLVVTIMEPTILPTLQYTKSQGLHKYYKSCHYTHLPSSLTYTTLIITSKCNVICKYTRIRLFQQQWKHDKHHMNVCGSTYWPENSQVPTSSCFLFSWQVIQNSSWCRKNFLFFFQYNMQNQIGHLPSSQQVQYACKQNWSIEH